MNTLISPAIPKLREPVQRLDACLRAVADALGAYPAFTSISLHTLDTHYVDSAVTVAIVNAPRPHEQLAFTNVNIVGHRVDLVSTYLGILFATRQSGLQPSKACPSHMVFGVYSESVKGVPAVIECVFDTTVDTAMPTVSELQTLTVPITQAVCKTLDNIRAIAAKHHSIADALLLHEPTMPNAYVIKWDVVQSTQSALEQYPLLREYVQAWSAIAKRIAEQHGGKVVAQTGDGQNIAFMLPRDVNRADRQAVRQYGIGHIVPVMRELRQTAQELHACFGYNARIAVGVGSVELTPLGEYTGKLFFELSGLLKQARAGVVCDLNTGFGHIIVA